VVARLTWRQAVLILSGPEDDGTEIGSARDWEMLLDDLE
jgi:hypothetical protein